MKICPESFGYNIDVVLCVDLSSFARFRIPEIRDAIALFGRRILEEIYKNDQGVASIRIKLIAFKDFGADSEPIISSDFFEMDEDGYSDSLRDFAERTVNVAGVRGRHSSALTALSLAMNSEWSTVGGISRHVIVLFTESGLDALGTHDGERGCPDETPVDLDTLHDAWENGRMERRKKRLLVFAPQSSALDDSIVEWTNTFMAYSDGVLPDELIGVGVTILVNSI